MARIPEPQPTSSTRAPPSVPASASASTPARHSRVVGCNPVPNAIPGSSARTTSSGARRWRRQVGRITRRRPIRMTGKYAFQASAQSASWTIAGPQFADRAQAERLEVPQRLGHLEHGLVRRGTIAGRHVRAHGRRPGQVQPRAESLLDQLEGRFDGCPAGCRSAQDLADGLDGLDVGLDRQLEPGARLGVAGRSASVGPLTHPSLSLSSNPPPCVTDSPVSFAYAASSSRAFLDSLVGTFTSTITCRSPR